MRAAPQTSAPRAAQVVIFAVPGAFTPTCSLKHLPGFIEKADELKAKGVETIACVAVNDAFVMDAWGKSVDAGDKVMLLADGSALFTKVRHLALSADLGGRACQTRTLCLKNSECHAACEGAPAVGRWPGWQGVSDFGTLRFRTESLVRPAKVHLRCKDRGRTARRGRSMRGSVAHRTHVELLRVLSCVGVKITFCVGAGVAGEGSCSSPGLQLCCCTAGWCGTWVAGTHGAALVLCFAELGVSCEGL